MNLERLTSWDLHYAAAIVCGLLLILVTLWDGFETMVLTRTVTRKWRFTGLYYFATRPGVYGLARLVRSPRKRNALLNAYPPLSLFALVLLWAGMLILGYALLYYGLRVRLTNDSGIFATYYYFSGVTFLTLGFGDVAPIDAFGRMLAITEAGTGFFFLALVISYLPVFYQAIQRREIMITMLDSRAGSTPSGHQLLHRYSEYGCMDQLAPVLKEYEKWGAELLEAYLSYPVLCFYRSQHDDQSWLMTTTAILDACAIIEAGIDTDAEWCAPLRMQAHCTFAMLRHMLVDLAYILKLEPEFDAEARLSPELHLWIRQDLRSVGLMLKGGTAADTKLEELRRLYEPYAIGISDEIIMPIPAFGRADRLKDNWEIAAWDGQSHTETGH